MQANKPTVDDYRTGNSFTTTTDENMLIVAAEIYVTVGSVTDPTASTGVVGDAGDILSLSSTGTSDATGAGIAVATYVTPTATTAGKLALSGNVNTATAQSSALNYAAVLFEVIYSNSSSNASDQYRIIWFRVKDAGNVDASGNLVGDGKWSDFAKFYVGFQRYNTAPIYATVPTAVTFTENNANPYGVHNGQALLFTSTSQARTAGLGRHDAVALTMVYHGAWGDLCPSPPLSPSAELGAVGHGFDLHAELHRHHLGELRLDTGLARALRRLHGLLRPPHEHHLDVGRDARHAHHLARHRGLQRQHRHHLHHCGESRVPCACEPCLAVAMPCEVPAQLLANAPGASSPRRPTCRPRCVPWCTATSRQGWTTRLGAPARSR